MIVPPVAKACEPLLGGYSLAPALRLRGEMCTVIDGNLGWFENQLERIGPEVLQEPEGKPVAALPVSEKRYQRALRRIRRGNPLRNPATFQNRDRYGQAVEHLQAALHISSGVSPDEEPGLADFRVSGLRPVRRQDLITYASRPDSVFDDYLHRSLLPEIAELNPRMVGISLTFLHQMFPAVRIAKALKERHPHLRMLAGGALVDCWPQADRRLAPFHLFDEVFSSSPVDRPRWQSRLGLLPPALHGRGFFVDPKDFPRKSFFSPERIVPLAFGMGCAWGRCTFCPDYLKLPYRPAGEVPGIPFLEEMVRDNSSLVIHITDSCVPPRFLDLLAQVVIERGWPVRWYAFVRLSEALLKPGRLERWAEGGCGLLQFGLESASPALLEVMQKGISVPVAGEILRKSAGLGIRNYVYLLFGFPGETRLHQEQTLDFVIRHQGSVHYLNNAIFSLPKNSPLAANPARFGIRELRPMAGEDSDLSLYLDFLDESGSARRRARQFLQETFLPESAVRRLVHALPPVFKSNHALLARW